MEEKDYGHYEVRSFGERAEPKMAGEDSRKIVGYAIVFGERSQILSDWSNRFEEIILPEAVSQNLIERSDIKALMEHNRERLLARSNRGQGTLRLTIDEVGLRYEFDAPNTVDGDTALELVRRGDISGSSFAFSARGADSVDKEWDDERKLWVYKVRRIDALYDVTLTSDPAYTQTSVEARSLSAPSKAPDLVPIASYYERIEAL